MTFIELDLYVRAQSDASLRHSISSNSCGDVALLSAVAEWLRLWTPGQKGPRFKHHGGPDKIFFEQENLL